MEVLNHQLAVFFLMILAGYLAYSCRLLTEELHDRLNTILMRLIILPFWCQIWHWGEGGKI